MQISKPAVAGLMLFCLDIKEPKDQECRIASGRHSALRAWVETDQGVYYSNAVLVGILSSRPEGEIFIEIFDSNLMKISPIIEITALNFISIKEASVVTYICFAAS